MKLAYAVYYVLLDGKPHRASEIYDRVKHFVEPEKALRLYTKRLNNCRISGRQRNQSDRVVLAARKDVTKEEDVPVHKAIWFIVISRTLSCMLKEKQVLRLGEDEDSFYVLSAEGKRSCKDGRGVAGGIGLTLKRNIMLRGELI